MVTAPDETPAPPPFPAPAAPEPPPDSLPPEAPIR